MFQVQHSAIFKIKMKTTGTLSISYVLLARAINQSLKEFIPLKKTSPYPFSTFFFLLRSFFTSDLQRSYAGKSLAVYPDAEHQEFLSPPLGNIKRRTWASSHQGAPPEAV